jgi:hypothetical protein
MPYQPDQPKAPDAVPDPQDTQMEALRAEIAALRQDVRRSVSVAPQDRQQQIVSRLEFAVRRQDATIRALTTELQEFKRHQGAQSIPAALNHTRVNPTTPLTAPADVADPGYRGPWAVLRCENATIVIQDQEPNYIFWKGHVTGVYDGGSITISGTEEAPDYVHVQYRWADGTISVTIAASPLGDDYHYFRKLLAVAYVSDGRAYLTSENPCWTGGHIHIQRDLMPWDIIGLDPDTYDVTMVEGYVEVLGETLAGTTTEYLPISPATITLSGGLEEYVWVALTWSGSSWDAVLAKGNALPQPSKDVARLLLWRFGSGTPQTQYRRGNIEFVGWRMRET